MAADGAGIRFGQYILLRRIARGGMAEVFLAQQRGLEGFDRRVAVKRILPHLVDAPDFVKMFLGEARLAAQLSHPNIVHIYEFGKVDSDYFIAMEYVDGVHAGQLFKLGEVDGLPPTMVARLGADAAAALHHAHELRAPDGRPYGLVHRDVSPANLMVSFDGVVKLCDFGIAKAAALSDQLTNPGQVKGKYAYMSPEQTTGTPLDGKSDVFSLGIVMWELLAGRTIVARGDVVEAMRAIRDGRLMPIERAAPRTPPALAAAITWALQTRREVRASAMQLAEQLEAFIKSSPELATPIQLGAWLRARFPRDATGAVSSLPAEAPAGTEMVPSTLGRVGTVPPQGGDARVGAPGPGPSVITSGTTSELAALGWVQRAAPAASGHALPAGADPVPRAQAPAVIPGAPAAQAPTLIAPQRGAEAATLLAGDRAVLDAIAPQSNAPRLDAAAARRDSPSQAIADLREVQVAGPAPGTRGSPVVGVPALTAIALPPPSQAENAIRRRRVRLALAIGGFVGLAVLSFAIVFAARGTAPAVVAGRDGAIAATTPRAAAIDASPRPIEEAPPMAATVDAPVDAAPVDRAPVDRAPVGRAPVDRALVDAATAMATAPPATAATDAPAPTNPAGAADRTILEVRTRPDSATVRVAGRRQVAPAQFKLPAGRYAIDAEVEGWMPERRWVELVPGERLIQDIVFTTRVSRGPRRARTGKLTVRTTPPCEVFLGTRRLTETPFTDMEFEPARYTLLFKHPKHATVIKHVTITAGKTTRLSFTLP